MYQVMVRTTCSGPAPPSASTASTLREGLSGLGDEIVGLELSPGVPADLATNKNLGAAGGHTVGVALGGYPAWG
jgi:hypothetical protein